MVNTPLLESYIAESGKTKTFLAGKLGITIQTLKKKCTNKNDFKLSEADVLCNELGIKTKRERDNIFLSNK